MTNVILWKELNISTEGALKPDYVFPEGKSGHGVHWKYKWEDIFTTEWVEKFFQQINCAPLDLSIILFFCERNNTNDFVHIDINEKNIPITAVPAAFNWVVGGTGSSMVWYNKYQFTEDDLWYGPVDPDWSNTDPSRVAPGAAIKRASELTEIGRLTVPSSNVTLVNTHVGHRIELGEQDRWCFSIRIHDKYNWVWDDYIQHTKNVWK